MNTRRATGTMTPTIGAASVNIYCSTGRIKQIFLQSTSGNTTFDTTLTDDNDNVVYSTEDSTQELNEMLDVPAYLNYTLAIENSSADEAFDYIVMIEE